MTVNALFMRVHVLDAKHANVMVMQCTVCEGSSFRRQCHMN